MIPPARALRYFSGRHRAVIHCRRTVSAASALECGCGTSAVATFLSACPHERTNCSDARSSRTKLTSCCATRSQTGNDTRDKFSGHGRVGS
jgi:hypothetical protein